MVKPAQPDLFGDPAAPAPAGPPGLGYWPDVLSAQMERSVVAQIEPLPLSPFEFQGYFGNRRTVYFGYGYDYQRGEVREAAPLPDWLLALRGTVAAATGDPADAFVQALVTEYAPGAGIGWHRDRPQFGVVAGVSLLAPASLRFRSKRGEGWERIAAAIAPRSVYRLSGEARHGWQHSIAPMKALRYSVTFRTLANGG